MTREQKLEAALREVRSYAARCIDGATICSIIDAALATPPTSEWSEAITEERIRALKRKEKP